MAIDVDVTADRLARWGRKARAMPRGAFEAEGQAHPLFVSSGERIGRIVPGHGLALDADLRALGITKKIPGVIERSPWMRLLERLADDRGAITSMSDLRAACQNGSRRQFQKQDTFTLEGAGIPAQQVDSFSSPITFATFGINGTVTTRTSHAGAYNAGLNDPASGKKKYLVGVSTLSTTTNAHGFGMGVYIDVLVGIGNISASSGMGAQTIGTPALTRYTSGVGVYYLLASQATVTVGYATTTDITVVYTNQAGTGSRSVTWTTNGANSGDIFGLWDPVASLDQANLAAPLQAGDFGLRSIQTINFSANATSGTNCGAMLYHPLFFLHAIPEVGVTYERDMRAEPEALVDFAVDGSGVLGYHNFLWVNDASAAASAVINFNFDTIEA